MNHQTPKLVYLASPYTHPDLNVRQDRYEMATMAAAKLMAMGFAVFSPIAHSHHIADFLPDGTVVDHEFWMRQDLPWLRKADALFVLRLEGWEESRGVNAEIHCARHIGMPVEFLDLKFSEGKVLLVATGPHPFNSDRPCPVDPSRFNHEVAV